MSNFYEFQHKTKQIDGKTYIYDTLRNKYLVLTPEEWVRQNFLAYLINDLGYAKNLIQLEAGLKYNALSKRTDINVYDRQGLPFLLIECKAQTVKITNQVLEQASRYNLVFKAPYLCVTNGIDTFCFEINFQEKTSKLLPNLPAFS
jgi:hypothetical protein